jgi:hypothetical protein
VYEDEVEFWYKDKEIMMAVDLQFLDGLDSGITTSLYDYWLLDVDFFQAYEELKDKRDIIEDAIIWDLIAFSETWYDIDDEGLMTVVCLQDSFSFDSAEKKLLDRHEKMRADIEAEAVKLGL